MIRAAPLVDNGSTQMTPTAMNEWAAPKIHPAGRRSRWPVQVTNHLAKQLLKL
jgi:hypothetical protein